MVNNLPASALDTGSMLDREGPLEKEIAAHSSILAWKIPWTVKPERLQSMRLQRVRHDLVTSDLRQVGSQAWTSTEPE